MTGERTREASPARFAPERPAAALALGDRLALRPAEAARALGIGERTLRALLPRLPHVRLEGVVLIPVAELQRWLREQVSAQAREQRDRVDDLVREGLEALGAPKSR